MAKLVEQSNKMFKKLSKQNISYVVYKYFYYNFNKATNLGNIYLKPIMLKLLSKMPDFPVPLNYDTLTKRVSQFPDHHLKPNVVS